MNLKTQKSLKNLQIKESKESAKAKESKESANTKESSPKGEAGFESEKKEEDGMFYADESSYKTKVSDSDGSRLVLDDIFPKLESDDLKRRSWRYYDREVSGKAT